MRETFDEWYKAVWSDSFSNNGKVYAASAWTHQQIEIDSLRKEADELIKALDIAKTALNKIYDNPYDGTSVSKIAEEAIQSIKSIRERKEVK